MALLAIAPAAWADSIVYEKDGNIWEARPDGSGVRQITTVGGLTKPTQADDGTIVAEKEDLLHRMDRNGQTLNTAGDSDWGGPLTPHLSPNGLLITYNYFRGAPSLSPGFHTSVSHSNRQTDHGEIFDISGWSNPSWVSNDQILMFDGSPSDTLIKTLGQSGTDPWYEDPNLDLTGGEIGAGATRFAATDGSTIRLYVLSAPPPQQLVDPRCDLPNPTGSFFRPTWAPDGARLAWQEDDGIWVGTFNLDDCTGGATLTIPGGKAPDWGPRDVSPQTSVGPGAGGGSGGGGVGTTSPTVGLGLVGPVPSLSNALRNGIALRVRTNRAGRATAQLLASGVFARGVSLSRTRVVGRGSRRLPRAGTYKVFARFTRKAKHRFRRMRGVTITARVTLRATGGGVTTKRRRIRLRR